MRSVIALTLVAAAMACTRVVDVRTTSEVRPMRYAITEFTAGAVPPDSALAYAKRALAAENIAIMREEVATGTVEGGPVHFDAAGDEPALDATVTITAQPQSSGSRFRVYASAVLPAGAVGGVDARLTALVERLKGRVGR
jgi:hypothetical protein